MTLVDEQTPTTSVEVGEWGALAGRVIGFVRKFLVLPNEYYELIYAVWLIHTWLIDAAHTTPYLYFWSKDPASGKTRALDVAGVLACNPHRGDDMTAPIMFKLIERHGGHITLEIDETDTIWSGSRNEWKRRTLNTGYKRGGCAYREEAREVKEFSTFCPKILAGLNNGFMPRTILDRCIQFPMEKKSTSVRVERFIERRVKQTREYKALTDAIYTFREEAYVDVVAMQPDPIPGLSDRQNEIIEPLMAIAQVLGCEDDLAEALIHAFQATGRESESPTQKVFARIKQAFKEWDEESEYPGRIWSRDLCAKLGPHYTGRQLALFLEPFDITPREVRQGNKTARGYLASDFEEMWEVYCPDAEYDEEHDDFDEVKEVVE